MLKCIHSPGGLARVLLSLLCAGGCADGVPEWCTAPPGTDVRVAREPAGWTAPPELDQRWRMDGSVPGRELVIPVSAAIDVDDRRIALVDFRLREVVVLGMDGSWIGRWGTSGAGPGEFTAPFAAAWREDGSLIVYDPARSKLVVFDRAGATLEDEPVDPAFTAALGGGARSIQLVGSGLLLAQPGPAFRGDGSTRTHVLVRGGPVGAGVDTVAQRDVPVIMAEGTAPITAPGFAVPVGALAGDTMLAVAGDTPDYMVRIYRNGEHALTICRDLDPLPLEQQESEPHEPDVPDHLTTAVRRAEPPSEPARIGRLVFDAAGRLWVQRDRPRALSGLDGLLGRAGALLDVYDPDGTWLGEVRLPETVRFMGATRDLILALEADELDVLSVVALRPEW